MIPKSGYRFSDQIMRKLEIIPCTSPPRWCGASRRLRHREIDLCDPRADELLVEVTASGMCATDLHGRDAYYTTQFPNVFGHEGAGIVRAVGSR